MPRWLVTLLVLLLLAVFVVPNPVQAGNTVGNAIQALGVFFQSAGAEISGTLSRSVGSASAGDTAGGSQGYAYPSGGVASGDGTTTHNGGAALPLGRLPTPVRASVGASATEAVPDAATDAATLPHSRPVQLRIPSIGVTSGFVDLGLESDGTMEIPQAADVVGWYREAPTPGERGPAVVTAHVDWQHERGVFHDLRQVEPGTDATVERADGLAVVFRVTRVEEYLKEEFPTDEVYGSTDGAELRLITCGGRYDPNTRNYEANVVLFARMVGVS